MDGRKEGRKEVEGSRKSWQEYGIIRTLMYCRSY
jgi:hypothetical protein